jgi:hypothetical protein
MKSKRILHKEEFRCLYTPFLLRQQKLEFYYCGKVRRKEGLRANCDGKIFWEVATWKTKKGKDRRLMELAQCKQAFDFVNLLVLIFG